MCESRTEEKRKEQVTKGRREMAGQGSRSRVGENRTQRVGSNSTAFSLLDLKHKTGLHQLGHSVVVSGDAWKQRDRERETERER
jgi:hypothetical protein